METITNNKETLIKELRREIIKELKTEIKKESETQKLEKNKLKNHLCKDETEASWTQSQNAYRAARITALLNFYNEIRGKEYRHNISKYLHYPYNSKMNELKEQYTVKTDRIRTRIFNFLYHNFVHILGLR